METDPILRAFGIAIESYSGMHPSSATAANPQKSASREASQPSAQRQPHLPATDDANAGMAPPSAATRQRFVHHGYRKAKQEQREWGKRNVAASEAADAQQAAAAAEPPPAHAAPPQHDANASVAAARWSAELAWQEAAQAAQSAAEQQANQHWAAGEQSHNLSTQHPGGWPPLPGQTPWQQQASYVQPPPQPPPPPDYAMNAHADVDWQQYADGAEGAQPNSAAAAPNAQHMQAAAAAVSDEDLGGLLTAWYNAGFETGRRYEKRRMQAQMQHRAAARSAVT